MFNNAELTEQMPRLEKFAMKLTRKQHDADDLLQATLLRAMEKKHLYKEDTNLFSWTSKMMYNLFVSNYRRKVKFETQYDPENYLEKQTVEPSQESEMELMKVNEAMSLLSEEHRDVLVYVCVQGMRYQEVADALDIPVGTVRSRLSRARDQLQNLLDTPSAKDSYAVTGNAKSLGNAAIAA
ncbi:MAG: sigma-70 family RNA polymerase sigma factor [Alphaproteobacteria bacterium]|nr:sigma-70 family RNA polymerase sigma factor [Alphaproteobacteria bacterium]